MRGSLISPWLEFNNLIQNLKYKEGCLLLSNRIWKQLFTLEIYSMNNYFNTRNPFKILLYYSKIPHYVCITVQLGTVTKAGGKFIKHIGFCGFASSKKSLIQMTFKNRDKCKEEEFYFSSWE